LLQTTPAPFAVQLGAISGLTVLASLVLCLAFPESQTTRTAFPFMFLLGGVGIGAAAWLWYFRRPRTNAATAGFLLGNMALVMLIVLPYALLTRDFRRRLDPPPRGDLGPGGPGEDGKVRQRRGPADQAALGYLPRDSNLIVGVDVARMLREPAGKALLDSPSWGPLEAALGQVEKWTGLKREAIDHIALGTRTQRFPFVRLTFVVRTVLPYDPTLFRHVLEQTRAMEHHGRLLYPIQLAGGGQGALWCVGKRTLLLRLWWEPTTFQEMKELLPLAPRREDEGLAPALRGCLEQRLPCDALAWVVGESVPVQVLSAVVPLARGRKGDNQALTPVLKEVRVFDTALRFAPGAEEVVVIGDLRCASATSAERLQGLLEWRDVPGLGLPRVGGPKRPAHERVSLAAGVVALGSSPGGPEASAALTVLSVSPAAVQGEAARWVRFQVRAAPGRLRQVLRGGRLFPGLGKL
jgi:hypothetical protein